MYKNQNIGDRIKTIREKLSLSQSEFALKLGISQSAISSYEKEIRKPPESVLRLIAGTFSVNIDYLRRSEEPMFEELEEYPTFKEQLDGKQLLDKLCTEYGLDSNSKKMLQEYLLLPDHYKQIVNSFLKFIKQIKSHK